ncbi:MAG: hypothetical protein JNJ88_11650 [Planctomycetes bacterium]|nr:hypothetical protein [Planctomycetota bacterium]
MTRRARRRWWIGAALAAVVAGFSAAASLADVVHTKDGRAVEGKIISDDGTTLRVQTALGVIEVRKADVARVEKKATSEELYEERRKAASTADDHAALGKWCQERRLTKQAKAEFLKAVELDPKHEAANRALGRVLDGADWVTPEEKKGRDAQRERAALEAQGLVEYRGRWVSKEEKEALEKGLVRVGDRWVTEADAMRAKGLAKSGDAWVPADELPFRERAAEAEKLIGGGKKWTSAYSKQFAVHGLYDGEFVRKVSEACEKGCEYVDKLLGGDGSGAVVRAGTPPHSIPPLVGYPEAVTKAPLRHEVLLLGAESEYDKAVARTEEESKRKLWPGWGDRVRQAYGFFVFEPLGISVAVQKDRGVEALLGHTLHQVGHVLINRHVHKDTLAPSWLDEAVAALTEYAATGGNSIFCIMGETRGTTTGGARKAGAIRSWREELKAAVTANKPLSFVAMVQRDLDGLSVEDIEKAMSIVEFLSGKDAKAFDRFLQHVRKLGKLERVPAEAKRYHDEALKAAFGMDTAGVEIEWARWFGRK